MPDLYFRFLDRPNFHNVWSQVAANHGCAGVDGETIAHFAAHADRHLEKLRSAIFNIHRLTGSKPLDPTLEYATLRFSSEVQSATQTLLKPRLSLRSH